MLNLIKKIFGGGPSVDYSELVKNGAMIVDVRTQAEFKQGHIKGAINIPLQTLQSSLGRINKNKPIITCCASGMRSASAKGILKGAGYSDVHNGGGWMSLQNKLNK